MTTILAGFMGGTLMGLVFVTHAALLLVFWPPASLRRMAAEGTVTKLIAVMALAFLFGWSLLGVAAAVLFEAMAGQGAVSTGRTFSGPYASVIGFIAAFTAMPAALFMRDRLLHLAFECAMFAGLFAFLIPGLVVAINR